jgi:hypothetical protein
MVQEEVEHQQFISSSFVLSEQAVVSGQATTAAPQPTTYGYTPSDAIQRAGGGVSVEGSSGWKTMPVLSSKPAPSIESPIVSSTKMDPSSSAFAVNMTPTVPNATHVLAWGGAEGERGALLPAGGIAPQRRLMPSPKFATLLDLLTSVACASERQPVASPSSGAEERDVSFQAASSHCCTETNTNAGVPAKARRRRPFQTLQACHGADIPPTTTTTIRTPQFGPQGHSDLQHSHQKRHAGDIGAEEPLLESLRIVTFQTQRTGGKLKSGRVPAQDMQAPSQSELPHNFNTLVGNPDWPLVRIGEAFQVWIDLPEPIGKDFEGAEVLLLPAHKHDAIRLKVGNHVVAFAAHFWDAGAQVKACLRCGTAADNCTCTTGNDLLELPRATTFAVGPALIGSGYHVLKLAGKSAHGVSMVNGNGNVNKTANTTAAAAAAGRVGFRSVGVEMRIPRDRKGSAADNSWLRKLNTLPKCGRLPKVMHLQASVTDAVAPGPPVYVYSGFSRLVAKNGGLKEKATLSQATKSPIRTQPL